MKIYITNPNANSNGSVVEMFLLEFQGEIETLAGEFRGQTLGELQVFDNAQAGGKLKYGIDIGIHHLEGKYFYKLMIESSRRRKET